MSELRRYAKYRKSGTGGKAKKSAKTATAVESYRLRRIAREEIFKSIETQDCDTRSSIIQVGAMGANNWDLGFQVLCLTPNAGVNNGIPIAQGSGEGSRRGNRISIDRATIGFTGIVLPYSATTNPTPKASYFAWYVVGARAGVPFSDLANAVALDTDFYDNGSGSLPASRTTFDLIRPFNKDKYIVYEHGVEKVFFSDYAGSGGGAGDGGFNRNNDFNLAMLKRLDVTKYLPKTVVFNDNNAVATTRHVWFVFHAVYADGSVMNVAHQPVQIAIVQDLRFKNM